MSWIQNITGLNLFWISPMPGVWEGARSSVWQAHPAKWNPSRWSCYAYRVTRRSSLAFPSSPMLWWHGWPLVDQKKRSAPSSREFERPAVGRILCLGAHAQARFIVCMCVLDNGVENSLAVLCEVRCRSLSQQLASNPRRLKILIGLRHWELMVLVSKLSKWKISLCYVW